jgi:heme/copper-type cytochrome/quinol oxidase subunit 2
MMRRRVSRLHPALLAAALLLVPRLAGACAVCFGDPDSPASKGLTAAVLFLVGVIVAVLAGVAVFAVSMLRRNERQHEHGAHGAALTGGTDG